MITGVETVELKGQNLLLSKWRANALDGLPAHRDAMHPSSFLTELAHVSIVEADAGELRFRISGSGLRTFLGEEARGKTVSAFAGLSKFAPWQEGLALALEAKLPVGGVEQLTDERSYHWLRLPLLSNSGAVCQVLCHDRIVDAEMLAKEAETAQSQLRRAA